MLLSVWLIKTGQVNHRVEDWRKLEPKVGGATESPAVTVDQSHRDPVKAGAGNVHKLNNVVSW